MFKTAISLQMTSTDLRKIVCDRQGLDSPTLAFERWHFDFRL